MSAGCPTKPRSFSILSCHGHWSFLLWLSDRLNMLLPSVVPLTQGQILKIQHVTHAHNAKVAMGVEHCGAEEGKASSKIQQESPSTVSSSGCSEVVTRLNQSIQSSRGR